MSLHPQLRLPQWNCLSVKKRAKRPGRRPEKRRSLQPSSSRNSVSNWINGLELDFGEKPGRGIADSESRNRRISNRLGPVLNTGPSQNDIGGTAREIIRIARASQSLGNTILSHLQADLIHSFFDPCDVILPVWFQVFLVAFEGHADSIISERIQI